MRFNAEDITPQLRKLLTDKAKRLDLLDGFEIEDSCLDRHQTACIHLHGEKSEEMRQAIAIYHALFDRDAAHAAAINPKSKSEPAIVEADPPTPQPAAPAAAPPSRLTDWIQIALQLAILVLLAALFAGRAHAQETPATPRADPCQVFAKRFAVISLTANTQIIAGTANKKTYVCAINLVAAAATNVALVAGTGTVCATGISGLAGGSTAATGWNFAANGGLTLGSGTGSVLAGATTGDNVCLLVSAANQISGTIAYVQQ